MSETVQNGNQELVYSAIARGARTVGDIERATGLDPDTISNHVRRLSDVGRVHRVNASRPAQYEVTRTGCLLAEAWR